MSYIIIALVFLFLAGFNEYNCSCLTGYSGRYCDEDYDDCLSEPCASNMTCIDAFNNYTCVCEPGNGCEVCNPVCSHFFIESILFIGLNIFY